MPKTFRGAVDICIKLNMEFLWIDSICIIQDDTHDWRVEASRMGSYYLEAFVAIAAHPTERLAATGHRKIDETADNGCHIIRAKPFMATIPGKDGASVRIFARKTHNHKQFVHRSLGDGRSSYFKRGWCFQERMLTPRILHFTEYEVVLECCETLQCECGGVASAQITPESRPEGRGHEIEQAPQTAACRRPAHLPPTFAGEGRRAAQRCAHRLLPPRPRLRRKEPDKVHRSPPCPLQHRQRPRPHPGRRVLRRHLGTGHLTAGSSGHPTGPPNSEAARGVARAAVAMSRAAGTSRRGFPGHRDGKASVAYLRASPPWTERGPKIGPTRRLLISNVPAPGLTGLVSWRGGHLTLLTCGIPVVCGGAVGPKQWGQMKLSGDGIRECEFQLDALEDVAVPRGNGTGSKGTWRRVGFAMCTRYVRDWGLENFTVV